MDARHARRVEIGDNRPGQHLSTRVKYTNYIAVADPPDAGILRVDKHRLFATYRIMLTQRFGLAEL